METNGHCFWKNCVGMECSVDLLLRGWDFVGQWLSSIKSFPAHPPFSFRYLAVAVGFWMWLGLGWIGSPLWVSWDFVVSHIGIPETGGHLWRRAKPFLPLSSYSSSHHLEVCFVHISGWCFYMQYWFLLIKLPDVFISSRVTNYISIDFFFISYCLWKIYIRLCSFHSFQHHLTTFTWIGIFIIWIDSLRRSQMALL